MDGHTARNPIRAKGPNMLRITRTRHRPGQRQNDAQRRYLARRRPTASSCGAGPGTDGSGHGRRDEGRQGFDRGAGVHRSTLPFAGTGLRIVGDYRDGTRAAARGGFTGCLPDAQHPAGERQRIRNARNSGTCRRRSQHARLADWRGFGRQPGEKLAEIAAMQQAGIVGVSDDGKPIATARLLRQVMEYCRSLDLPVIDHCEDASLFAGNSDA